MVLSERFELSASPLPRECSTPELRQLTAKPYGTSIMILQVVYARFPATHLWKPLELLAPLYARLQATHLWKQ